MDCNLNGKQENNDIENIDIDSGININTNPLINIWCQCKCLKRSRQDDSNDDKWMKIPDDYLSMLQLKHLDLNASNKIYVELFRAGNCLI